MHIRIRMARFRLGPHQAIYLITTGARNSAFRNIKSVAECLADEIQNAAKDCLARAHSGSRHVVSCVTKCRHVSLTTNV